ncbi:MAG: hypothetical protein RMJ13_07805 [Elusimicrobiota bacterium]|nr:hypothetical protein [Elusimicrobiota bacterium]
MVKIPDDDRIRNKYPPRDPTDKTELNADNVMLIFDKIVNGEYRMKLKIWNTYDEFLQNAEECEIGVVIIENLKRLVIKLNGEIIILGG